MSRVLNDVNFFSVIWCDVTVTELLKDDVNFTMKLPASLVAPSDKERLHLLVRVIAATPAIASSRISKLVLVVVPQTPDCSPVPIFSIPRFVYVEGISLVDHSMFARHSLPHHAPGLCRPLIDYVNVSSAPVSTSVQTTAPETEPVAETPVNCK